MKSFDKYKVEEDYKKFSSSTFGNENQFNKAVYECKIIQGMFERINELEDRIKKLEEEENKKKNE